MTNYFSLQHRKDAETDVVPYGSATRKLKQNGSTCTLLFCVFAMLSWELQPLQCYNALKYTQKPKFIETI